MRFIHTSDWHLGRTFHGADMRGQQQDFLDFLIGWTAEHAVDAVLVAGDVYDRALPGPDVIEMFDDAVDRLLETGAQVIVTSGNHDSGPRLGYGRRRFERAGFHIRSRLADLSDPVTLRDAHGPVDVYGIPYLEPGLVWRELGAARRTHQAVMQAAIERVLAGRDARPPRSVLMAHAFVTGAEPSESERDISLGGVGNVGASLFSPFSYTALGHIHRPQVLGERLRYSGSPLAYSFSEADTPKSFWLVDIGATEVEVRGVPVPTGRRLAVLEGSFTALLTDPEFEAQGGCFVSARLDDPVRVPQAMSRLRERFPHLVHLEWTARPPRSTPAPAPSASGADDELIFARYVEHVRGSSATPEERSAFTQALMEARSE